MTERLCGGSSAVFYLPASWIGAKPEDAMYCRPVTAADLTDEMVERSASGLWDHNEACEERIGEGKYAARSWEAAHELDRQEYRDKARAMLEAVFRGD